MGNICHLIDGEKQKGYIRTYIDVKFLRTKNNGKQISCGKYVEKGKLLILVDGENSGEIFKVPISGYQGSTFKILEINNLIYEDFILIVIKFYQKIFRNTKVGSAIPHLNRKLFKEINVLIPPYNEQRRIVRSVNQLFDCIDNISEAL